MSWVEQSIEIQTCTELTDLLNLYVLFSQYRSRGYTPTLENCFSQISFYSYAHVCIIYEKTKRQVPLEPLLGKQNIQAKEVYYSETATYLPCKEKRRIPG